jgi:hypothetical protein
LAFTQLFIQTHLGCYLSDDFLSFNDEADKSNPLYIPVNLHYILSHINRPTYETTFTLKVPYKRG